MNRHQFFLALLGCSLMGAPSIVLAAKAKPTTTRKSNRRPAPPPVEAAEPASAITLDANGLMTPAEVQLRPMKAPEAIANAVWSLRAALNIAALQCQFSPFLASVNLYNALQRQHGDEFDRARLTMISHFARYDGARAQNSFDQYTTRTYNSFSTLDAQLAFCDRAALVARELLTVPKGALAPIAKDRTATIRAALVPVSPLAFLGAVDITPLDLPPL